MSYSNNTKRIDLLKKRIMPNASAIPKEILFIDQNVDDYQILINSVKPGIAVHLLNYQQDGILQLTEILKQYTSLEAIHIVSHGNSGYLTLGNGVLSITTLNKYQQALFSWQAAFKQNADILIYGCNVAQGTAGEQFISQLIQATQTNIAASSQLVGHEDLGGSWFLNVHAQPIQTTIAFKHKNLKNFHATLVSNTLDFSTANVSNFVTATHSTTNFGTINFKIVSDVNSTGTANGSLSLATSGTIDVSLNDFFYNGTTDGEYLVIYTDGREVDFQSLKFGSSSSLANGYTDLTFYAYKDGTLLGNQTLTPAGTTFPNSDAASELVTLTSTDFDNADEIRMIGTNSNGSFVDVANIIIDDLILADAIIPNTTPIISIDNTNLSYTENAAATQIDSAATVSDSDGDADWNGGTLEVQITANNEAADRISISDTDGDGTAITVSGTNIFANGTDIGDLSASDGTVTNGTKLTITFDADATNANVQEVLQSIRYDSTSENPGTTNRTITFTATDKNAASANDTRTIAVTSVNDEPTLTATGSNPSFTEGGSAASLYSSSAVSTIESGQTVTGLTLTVTNVNDGSSELLNADGTSIALTHGTSGTTATNSLSYSVAVAGGTATVTLSGGTLSTAAAQTLINGISYQNNSQNPNTSNRVVTITSLTDSGGTANSGDDTVTVAIASTITVASINDDPSITGLPTDITVTEDTASDVNLSAATFSDVDASSNSITLTLAAGAGLLTATSGGGVTVGGSGTATLTLSGTTANIDTFLNTASNIQYTTASNAAGNNVTTLTLTANDGGNTGTGGGTNVALGAVNIDSTEIGDTPSVTNATTNEDTQTTSGLVLSRNVSDSTAVTHFKITNITGGTLFKNDGTTAIANNDFITFAEGNAGLKFTPSNNSTASGSFDIQAGTDGVGGGLSTGSATATITVNAVNDRPSLTNLNGDTVTYFVAGTAVTLDDGANVTLTDIDSSDFNGGNVTVSVVANAQIAEDKLQIGTVGAISTSASDVIHSDSGGTTIGTFSGGTGGTDLVITLNANATAARTQDLLKALQYVNTDAATTNTAARTVRITVDDGDGGDSPSTNQDVTVNLQALPTITSATYDVSTGQLVLTGTDFVAQAGATNDVIANKLTITGEGNASYALTDTANVEISSATSATLTLSATDKLNIDGLLNKNSTSSGDGTTYNINAADGWMPQAPGDESDSVNGITVSNVAVPTIVSAVYDAPNHNLFVAGTNFFKKPGANNDIDASKLTMIGGDSASYTLQTTADVEITSATSFTIHLSNGDDSTMYGIYNQLGTQSSFGTIYDLQAADGWLTAADPAVDISDNTAEGGVNVTINPMFSSSTYNATTGVLVVTGSNFEATAGAANDIIANKFTFTGEGGGTYTLTDTANVDVTSNSAFTLTLSATDRAAINQIVNKNGTASVDNTTYNLAAADDWCACPSTAVADISDSIGITVNNIPVPTITSATYNAATGVLAVTGTGFLNTGGAANDIIANKFTITGEGGETYTLTDTANVDITSGTAFTLTLSTTDQAAVNLVVNKDGTTSTGGTTYNLAAAEDWAAGADAAVNVVDATGNGITASNVAAPTITSATYNTCTGVLAVTCTGLLKLTGANNDIDASLFTFTGLGGGTYTLTDTADVDISSGATFSLILSATDKAAVNVLLDTSGTAASDTTTYNLAAAEDWAAGADTSINVADDITGNSITVINLPVPTITAATYNANTGVLVVTGTDFLSSIGIANDIIANKLTITGEGGETYTLTDTANVDISSGTTFTLTLSATDKAAVNQIINKDGTTSTGGTTYNLAAAEDWAAGADAVVNVVDATGNGITVSNVAAPTITSATYNTGTGVLVVTGTGLLKLTGANNDIDASLFTFTGLGGGTYTLTDTADTDITSVTAFTLTLSATDKAAVNALLDANGTAASDTTTYNLAAAEDWATGADATVNIVDTAGNGITVTIPPPSGSGGGTTTPPAPTTTTVDGTMITTQTETDGSTTLTVPVIEETRAEDPNTLLDTHADIPVLTNDADDPILTVSLPIGVGLSVNGQTEPLSAQDAINDLVNRIAQETATDSNTLPDMTVRGQDFIASLSTDEKVSVQTITPIISSVTPPSQPIIISSSTLPSDGKIALVIDASNLPSGTVLQLDNVAFAVIVGAVRVVGGAGENFVVGDDQSQFIVLGEDNDLLFGGGGDDTIGSLGGDDQTSGDAGNDIVYGGTGNDILTGGTGNDSLNGGFGFDIAVQPSTLIDYQITINGNQIILTHSNGETDTLTDVELVQFESGPSLSITHSEAETAAHHLVKTWLGRDLTVAEGNAIQNWVGADNHNIVNAFRSLPDAIDFKNMTTEDLLAGLNENPTIIRLNANREFVGNDNNNQGYLQLGLARNVDGSSGHDVLKMHNARNDVHLEQTGSTLEITRLEDGAMLNLRNAEMVAFDSGENVLLAHNEVEGILGRLFRTFFDRDATIAEWQLGREALANGVNPNLILNWFQTHASLSTLDDADYIQALYTQTLGRSATGTELNQQLTRLDNGEITREWLAVDIANSDEAITTIGSVLLLEGSI